MTTTIRENSLTQAEQFRAERQDFFFEDAHYLVEAEASTRAKEIGRNLFEFPDGSLFRISRNVMTVQTYKNRDELNKLIELQATVPAGIILPQDC